MAAKVELDIKATEAAFVEAIHKETTKGWNKISGLVAAQSKMMTQQAAWIAESSAYGALKDDPDLRKMFADQLASSVESLSRDIAALSILTVEQVWNAAVGVLWNAINKVIASATGGLLALPVL